MSGVQPSNKDTTQKDVRDEVHQKKTQKVIGTEGDQKRIWGEARRRNYRNNINEKEMGVAGRVDHVSINGIPGNLVLDSRKTRVSKTQPSIQEETVEPVRKYGSALELERENQKAPTKVINNVEDDAIHESSVNQILQFLSMLEQRRTRKTEHTAEEGGHRNEDIRPRVDTAVFEPTIPVLGPANFPSFTDLEDRIENALKRDIHRFSDHASTIEPALYEKRTNTPPSLADSFSALESSIESEASTLTLQGLAFRDITRHDDPQRCFYPDLQINTDTRKQKSRVSTPMSGGVASSKSIMTTSPIGLQKEFEDGKSLDSSSELMADQSRYVTTPYEQEIPHDQSRNLRVKVSDKITQSQPSQSQNETNQRGENEDVEAIIINSVSDDFLGIGEAFVGEPQIEPIRGLRYHPIVVDTLETKTKTLAPALAPALEARPSSFKMNKDWSSTSYRSGTSVTTSIGSDTDDTEYTEHKIRPRKMEKKPWAPAANDMPTLAEESSDDDSFEQRETEIPETKTKESPEEQQSTVFQNNVQEVMMSWTLESDDEWRKWFKSQPQSTRITNDNGSKVESEPKVEQQITAEKLLQRIFSQVLFLGANAITRDSNFIHLGGDSVAALRLVSQARRQGFCIQFNDVYRYPVLKDMATCASKISAEVPISPQESEHGEAKQTDHKDIALKQLYSFTSDLDLQNPHEDCEEPGLAHLFSEYTHLGNTDWTGIQIQLPESWMWDVDYHSTPTNTSSCWTCTPIDDDIPKSFPLTIAGASVVLPVEYTWPPLAGVNPPPDPRPSAPIDCKAEIPLEVVRDLFLTFAGSLGFYLLINGVLQIIVDEDFDKAWAASHLPHKYGGLKVCYIAQNMDPTMSPRTSTLASKTETTRSRSSLFSMIPSSPTTSTLSSSASFFQHSPSSRTTSTMPPSLQLNDFIEARTKSSHRKEKFAGRIGAKIEKGGEKYLVMSSHVITEAILAKSHRAAIFGRSKKCEKLEGDWNEHVEIWAGNEKIGTINKSFDPEPEVYPNGFMHDLTLIKPINEASVKDIKSPIPNLGWLSKESWNSLRQQTSSVKILGETDDYRTAKSLKTNRPSEVLVVGEGIFLNQSAASKPTKDHDISTWKDLVCRALLYRVYPDFDPPNGYSGIGLYADGVREDGTEGPGIVGFQSFVQRSGHVQNFEMEGVALEKRLKLGRVAFYGAFQTPDILRREYAVV